MSAWPPEQKAKTPQALRVSMMLHTSQPLSLLVLLPPFGVPFPRPLPGFLLLSPDFTCSHFPNFSLPTALLILSIPLGKLFHFCGSDPYPEVSQIHNPGKSSSSPLLQYSRNHSTPTHPDFLLFQPLPLECPMTSSIFDLEIYLIKKAVLVS